MNYEEYRQRRIANMQKHQKRIQQSQQRREVFIKEGAETKVASMDNIIRDDQRVVQTLQTELSIARPEKPEDSAERKRIRLTYAKAIAQSISDDTAVFFHGVKALAYLEPILSSGYLGYTDDEETRSTTSPGSLDVTTKDSIETSLGFMGLELTEISKFVPAGCMFVIAPKNEQEKAYAKQDTGTQHNILTVDFAKNPERIVAIVSTTENQDYIKGLCQKYGVSTDKVCTFDGFIERMQRENQKTPRMTTRSLTDICEEGHEKQKMRSRVIQAKRMDNLKRQS